MSSHSMPETPEFAMGPEEEWSVMIGGEQYPVESRGKPALSGQPEPEDRRARFADDSRRSRFTSTEDLLPETSPKAEMIRSMEEVARELRAEVPPSSATVEILEKSLRARLAFAAEPDSYEDRSLLIRHFSKSIKFIIDCRTQFREVIEALWRLNTEFHCRDRLSQPARDAFLNRHNEALSKITTPMFTAVNPTITAEVESAPLHEVEEALRRRLYRETHSLAVQIRAVLDDLTKHAIVGVWKKTNSTACNAYFFRYVIVQEHLGEEVYLSEPQIVAIHDTALSSVRAFGQVETKIIFGQHTWQIATHRLTLRKLQSYSVPQFQKTVPQTIKHFLKQLPDWLRDCIEIVGGERISYRIVARDVFQERFQESEKKLNDPDIDVEIKGCPLVVIGHYVLTGWGQEEDRIELSGQWSKTLSLLAIILLVLTFSLAAFGGWAAYASAVVATLALSAHVAGHGLKQISRKQPARPWMLVLRGCVWFAVTIGLLALAQGIASHSTFLMAVGIGWLAVLAFGSLLRYVLFTRQDA